MGVRVWKARRETQRRTDQICKGQQQPSQAEKCPPAPFPAEASSACYEVTKRCIAERHRHGGCRGRRLPVPHPNTFRYPMRSVEEPLGHGSNGRLPSLGPASPSSTDAASHCRPGLRGHIVPGSLRKSRPSLAMYGPKGVWGPSTVDPHLRYTIRVPCTTKDSGGLARQNTFN